MKLLTLKFILIFIYLISSSSSYAIQQPNLKNLIVHKDPKKLEKINFININNETIDLKKFENSLVIINFWATWCLPCKKEMPSLDRLYQDSNFKNLQVFAVNMETHNTSKTKKFFTDLNIKKLEIFFDPELNFVKEFRLKGVPTTILINKKGEEFARIIGEVNFQDKNFFKWLLKYD